MTKIKNAKGKKVLLINIGVVSSSENDTCWRDSPCSSHLTELISDFDHVGQNLFAYRSRKKKFFQTSWARPTYGTNCHLA